MENWKQQYYDLLDISEDLIKHREGTDAHEYARKRLNEVIEEEDSTE